jgi:hypothetical protein
MRTKNLVKTTLKLASSVALATCLMAAAVSSSHARDVSGVNMEESYVVDGQNLILNGAGVHVINRVNIFAIGYYLPKQKTTQAELLASPGPIRMKLVMIKAVESELMSRRFLADMRTSTTKEERIQLLGQLLALGQGFATVGDWKVGDVMSIEWNKSKGTSFYSNGKHIGEPLKDDLTMQAIMRIWVGDNSASPKLKRQLLGEKD